MNCRTTHYACDCQLKRMADLEAKEKQWAERSKDLHETMERLENENLRFRKALWKISSGINMQNKDVHYPYLRQDLIEMAKSALAPEGD